MLITDEVDFILDNYKVIEHYGQERIKTLLAAYKDRIIVVRDGNCIKGIALYFKLTHGTFYKLKFREMDLSVPDNINICRVENGDNIHFFMVVADGLKTILQGLRPLMKDARTVSWFSPDMTKFFIRRLPICLQ